MEMGHDDDTDSCNGVHTRTHPNASPRGFKESGFRVSREGSRGGVLCRTRFFAEVVSESERRVLIEPTRSRRACREATCRREAAAGLESADGASDSS